MGAWRTPVDGVRAATACPRGRRGGGEEEAAEGEAQAAKPEKQPLKTFGGTPLDGTSYEIDYHFDLSGDTLTVIAYVPAGGSIASLTPYFRPADWPEREIMEMYSIAIPDHPDPRRLFIDPSIDTAVLETADPILGAGQRL